jgi:D-alanyl-D-alanine carboxypeptidase
LKGEEAMKRKLLIILLGLTLPTLAIARNGQENLNATSASTSREALEKRIDDYLQAEMRIDKIPGLSIVVVGDGKVLLMHGYGLANHESKKPVTPETAFEVGSITKQFTATAIMLLVEQGRLKLDDPITKNLDNAPAAWNGITVRHLLTHTSGIPDFTKLGEFKQKWKNSQLIASQELLQVLRAKPLEFIPGKKSVYGNSNYHLLGMIVEKVSGQGYKQFMAENIFKPLGMNTTRVTDGQAAADLAQGYETSGSKANYIKAFGEGGIVSTAQDLAKWAAALDSARLLKQESLEQMRTGLILNDGRRIGYGFAFIINRDRSTGNKIIEHGGFSFGFSNFMTRLALEKLTVFVLTNSDKGYARFYSRGVAALYAPWFKEFWASDEIDYREQHKKWNSDHLRSVVQGVFG